MADVDDLLGGPSLGIDEMDDLLGGASIDDGLALDDDLLGGGDIDDMPIDLDDDLLGGGGGSSDAAAPTKAAVAPIAASAPPPPNQGRRRAVAFPALKEFPDGLRPFAGETPDIYFIRACRTINRDQIRTKKIIAVTTDDILVFNENDLNPARYPVSKVFGIITQTVMISKLFGSKEAETHVLIQMDGSADIFFALSKETENGNALNDSFRDRDVLQALSAVCAALGMTVPMSSLKDEELIEKFYNCIDTVRGDEKVRKQESELLSVRTALLYELKMLKKESETLYTQIETVKSSTTGSARSQLMDQLKDAKAKLASLEATSAQQSKDHAEALRNNKTARLALEAEDEKRSSEAKATTESAAQEALLEQLAEYEIMKNAHRRETEKIGALTAMQERRLKERGGKVAFAGVADISLRMESLEEELDFIEARTKQGKDQHSRHLSVLTQAKKLTAGGKAKLQVILDELKELEDIKNDLAPGTYGTVPSTISRDQPEKLEMPQSGGVAASAMPAAQPARVAPPTGGASAAPPAAAKRPIIDLSDDDI